MQVLPGLELINDHQHAVVAMLLCQLAVDVLEAGTNVSSPGNLDVDRLCCLNDCPRGSCGSLCTEEIFGGRMIGKAACDVLCDTSSQSRRASCPTLSHPIRRANR